MYILTPVHVPAGSPLVLQIGKGRYDRVNSSIDHTVDGLGMSLV